MATKKKATQEFDPQTYAYPSCRMQHQWVFYDGTIETKSKLAYQVDKCQGCSARRYTTISMRSADYGEKAKPSSIRYPDDYLVRNGLNKSDKGKLRMRNFFAQLENSAN